MNHFTVTDPCNCGKYFCFHGAVVGDLIPGNVNHKQTDPVFCKILLKLQFAINRQQHIESILSDGQERPVLIRTPSFFMNRGRLMIYKKALDAGVYALVNEDAHSRTWEFATSSTAKTCSRAMPG